LFRVRPLTLAVLALAAGSTFSPPAFAQARQGTCAQLTDELPVPEFSFDPNVTLTADQVDLSEEGLSKLLGSVKLRQGDKEFTADSLDYDETERTVSVETESLFRNRELIIRSERATFDIDDQTGTFSGTAFTLPERAARGTSGEVQLAADGTARLKEARYTTCAPGDNAWYLEAGTIKLDHEEGLGTATNARLRLMGVPVLYIPWMQFPIDDRRRTGLLFPTIGESSRTGWDLRLPLYLNLAPNYDATVTPRYMSDRGLQTTVGGRYLLPSSQGSASYEYLGEDRATGEKRDYVQVLHRGLFNRRTAVDLRYANVSDREYLEDFGGRLDLSSITHLERSARLTYQSPGAYTIQALVQDYQAIASNLQAVDDPYRRLPQIRIDGLTRDALWNTRAGISGEYVNFVRDASVEGQRVDLHPFLRMERDQVAWFAKSQLDFRYTTYELTGTAPGQPTTVNRSLPLFSAEAGLRFERVTDGGAAQTLEPRLFYLYVPYESQDDVPVFDSGEPDFDFTQLFARNRFSGEDRISDANQFAVAVTGRQLDADSGAVKAAVSLGQLFRFQAPRVTLPGEPAPDRGATDFIGSIDYFLDERWAARLGTQWSPADADFTRSSVALRYLSDRRRFEAAYRYRADLLEQTDLIAVTPLWGPFSLSARWRYSLRDGQSLDTFAGIEYETCCWMVRTSYRRYVADTSGDMNSGIYIQLELKGLARIGSGLENLFPDPEVY
jgi:LPS-assembly protein